MRSVSNHFFQANKTGVGTQIRGKDLDEVV